MTTIKGSDFSVLITTLKQLQSQAIEDHKVLGLEGTIDDLGFDIDIKMLNEFKE